MEYEAKLNQFVAESEDAIQAQVDHIWTVVTGVMEDAGVPVCNGLGIAIHLVDMLPSILANMAFHTLVPMLTSIAPEVYASKPWLKANVLDFMHTLPPHSNCMAMEVLCDEIVHSMGGVPKVATEYFAVATFAMSSGDYLGGQEGDVGARDGTTKSLHVSHTPHSPGRHSQSQSPSLWHHPQSAQSSSSCSSGSSSRSGSASGSSVSGSSRSS